MRSEADLVVSCLVDTDVCIDFLRKKEYARKLLHGWLSRGLLSVSAITHLEIYAGILRSEEQATGVFLDSMVTMPVDKDIARSAGNIIRHLKSRGLTISPSDAIIAASALYSNVPLVTNNISDYPVSEISGLIVIKGTDL
ncbi:MAG: PIN domain-containing protein [Dehalococcoidia bacterium]|nr:PIN domain-containing protein [Dehalococcoidia bacterium]